MKLIILNYTMTALCLTRSMMVLEESTGGFWVNMLLAITNWLMGVINTKRWLTERKTEEYWKNKVKE